MQDKLQAQLEKPGADFDALVKDFNLQKGEVAEYHRGSGGAPLGESADLDGVVFSSTVLDEKRVGGPVALGEDRIVIVKALEHKKAEPKPLASVRDEIVKSIREETGRTEAAKAADLARTKLAGGASFEDVAKELGVTAEPARFIGRDDPSVPAPVRTAAFDAGEACRRQERLSPDQARERRRCRRRRVECAARPELAPTDGAPSAA